MSCIKIYDISGLYRKDVEHLISSVAGTDCFPTDHNALIVISLSVFTFFSIISIIVFLI